MPIPSHDSPAYGTGRVTALGAQLIEIHDLLRDDLDDLRAALDEFLAHPSAPPALTRRLQEHCLSFCSAVTVHHSREDASLFPWLAAEFPHLAPVIEQLERDHSVIAQLLGSLDLKARALVDAPDDATRRRLRGDVEGISALLENHLAHEERVLVTPLNEAR